MADSAVESRTLAGRLARHAPFFYGWIIAIIGFLCVFIMGSTTFWAIPIFVNPMHDATGWSNTSIFAALSLNFMTTAAGMLFLGRFTDRENGAARMLLVGVLLLGLSLIALRWVQSPIQFILLFGGLGGLGGTAIRLMQATIVPKWFVARRGTAVGVSSNGGSISALIMVPLIALLIDQLGWRDAWSALGVLVLVMLLPLVPFVVRAPEDLGLLPDNGMQPRAGARSASTERSMALHEVTGTWQFWLLLLGVLFGNFSLQAHTAVMIPYLQDIGFSSQRAATALSVYGLVAVGIRFLWGVVADKKGVRLAIITQAAVTAFGCFMLMQIGGLVSLYLIIGLQGVTMSGYPLLQIMVWPEFFGRTYIGSIIGVTQPFATVFGALGPILAGFIFDHTGTYTTALWMLIGTWLTCSAVMFLVKPPARVD